MNRKTYSYYIDDKGILKIYEGNCLLAEICDCKSKSKAEINKLIDEVIEEIN